MTPSGEPANENAQLQTRSEVMPFAVGILRPVRHREERSDVAIQARLASEAGLLHFVRNDETTILQSAARRRG